MNTKTTTTIALTKRRREIIPPLRRDTALVPHPLALALVPLLHAATSSPSCPSSATVLGVFVAPAAAADLGSPDARPKVSYTADIAVSSGTRSGCVGPCRGSLRHGLAYRSSAAKTRSHRHSSASEKLGLPPCFLLFEAVPMPLPWVVSNLISVFAPSLLASE